MGVFREAAETWGFAGLARAASLHLGKIGFVAYGYLTLFGVLHDIALELRTGLNPFAFYGVEGFFLAGARHPGGVLIALAVPLSFMLLGYFLAVLSVLYFRLAGRLLASRLTVPRETFASGANVYFGKVFGGCCLLAAAVFFVVYLALVPFLSVAVVDDNLCARTLTLVFKGEGDKEGRKAKVRLLSGADTILFVRDLDTEIVSAVRAEETISLSTEPRPSQLPWVCPLLN